MRQRGSGDWKGFLVNTQFLRLTPQPSVQAIAQALLAADWAPTPEKAGDSALQGQGVVGRNAIDTQLSALLAVIQLHYQPIGGQLAPQLALQP